jgi:prefoldin subunit 2
MAAPPEPRTEQQVIARFNELRGQAASLQGKIIDLEGEIREHDLVVKTLKPMDTIRRCYRLVGDVLVERTVGEALPAVQRNRDNIEGALQALVKQLEAKQKELEAFQTKYKIRFRGEDDEDDQQQQQQQQQRRQPGSSEGKGKGATAPQGVLVS